MRSSRVFLTRIPSRTRISFFSATSAKTLTITLQGVQAIYCLLVRPLDWGVAMAIDSIFFPLALLGLLRLPAAIWLTEDYSYADYNTDVKIPQVPASNRDSNVRRSEDRPFTQPKTLTSLHPISLWITGLKRAHNHRHFVQLQHLIRSSPPKSLHKYMNPMLLLIY
jgi:hypothetical protein